MIERVNDDLVELLPADALSGKSLGISVSESVDLARLGLIEDHFRMAVGEIGRCVLIAGGNLYYGGHLRPDGYTTFLINELHRYGHRRRPLKVCLSWSEHLCMPDEEIDKQRDILGLFGEVLLLDETGRLLPNDFKKEGVSGDLDVETVAQSLTSLRRFMADETDARIMIGGKRTGFQGEFPGLIEEAFISIERNKPLFLAGGFGGVTLNVIQTLEPEFAAWFPLDTASENADERMYAGLERLLEIYSQSDWEIGLNRLTPEENAHLCATYRPSEIAAFIGLGLGRITNTID